jgi:hypothetical protein
LFMADSWNALVWSLDLVVDLMNRWCLSVIVIKKVFLIFNNVL